MGQPESKQGGTAYPDAIPSPSALAASPATPGQPSPYPYPPASPRNSLLAQQQQWGSAHSLAAPPASPGGPGYPFGGPPPSPGVDGSIPYTLYSVEKTPEKEAKNHQQNRKSSMPPSPAHTIADDPHLEKFKRIPPFTPLLASSKKQNFDELDTKGIFTMLAEVKTYYTNHAKFLARETENMSCTITQMDLACEKAKSLAIQHFREMQKLASTFPNVEQICTQVAQTKATVTKIKDSLAYLEGVLEVLESNPPSSYSSHSAHSAHSSHSSFSSFSSIPSFAHIHTSYSPSVPHHNPHNSFSSFNDQAVPEEVKVVRPPRPKTKSHESPYLAAKPRGATSKLRASISEGVPPPQSPPAASPLEVWTENIIPKWNDLKVRETPWVRSMWKTGIPKPVRGKVWRLAIEDKLALTLEAYNKLLEECDSAESEEAQKTLREIEVDVNRTFASTDMCDIDEFRAKLLRVLKAYSKLNSELGYVQGMSYIAGMFLQYMDDYDAFVCMSNLMENKFLYGLFRLDMEIIDQYVSVFGSLLCQIEPKLDTHFNEIGLIPQHYLLQWWLPIFSKSLPLEICSKVWDCFILEGEIFCFVASLGILRMYKKSLKRMDMENCKKLLSNLPNDIPEDALFEAIESIPAPLYNSYLGQIHGKPT